MNSSTLGIYQQVPRSFNPPVHRNPRTKRDLDDRDMGKNRDDKKVRMDESKKLGYLLVTSGSITCPAVLKKIPCKNFAIVGRYCRHKNCKFAHDMFPNGYNDADKKVICHVIDNANNARFAN